MGRKQEIGVTPGMCYDVPVMGGFYDLILRLGETTKDKTGMRGLLDEWYTTNFNSGNLLVKISCWRNDFTSDNFLNQILIRYKEVPVYEARVHRYNPNFHRISVLNKNSDWMMEVVELLASY